MEIIYLGTSRIHRNRANLIQTLHTVSAIYKLGIDIKLYLPSKKLKIDVNERLKEFGIKEKIPIYFSSFLHSRWKRFNYILFILLYRKKLKKAKHVYLRSPELSLGLIKCHIPHNLEIHDVDTLKKKNLLTKIISAQRAKLINWLFPISLAAATQLKKYGAIENRIKVLPSGVDLSLFEKVKPLDLNGLKTFPKICYIGRISKTRGLKIFEKIALSKLGEVHLVGELEDTYTFSSFIKYHGPVPHKEVPLYYDQSHVILLPYQPELEHVNSISPIKLFEAMASGRPIIASDIPPIREILTHEENALLVNPKDEKEWIKAIKKLKEDLYLAKKISNNAKKMSVNYSWEKRAKKIIKTLFKL